MNRDAQKSLSGQGTTEDLWWKCNLEYKYAELVKYIVQINGCKSIYGATIS